jgi:hypothetical protein
MRAVSDSRWRACCSCSRSTARQRSPGRRAGRRRRSGRWVRRTHGPHAAARVVLSTEHGRLTPTRRRAQRPARGRSSTRKGGWSHAGPGRRRSPRTDGAAPGDRGLAARGRSIAARGPVRSNFQPMYRSPRSSSRPHEAPLVADGVLADSQGRGRFRCISARGSETEPECLRSNG